MTTLKVSSPAELISAVPFLIGFHPADSLAVVAMQGSHITFAIRIDLPERGTPEQEARAAVLHLATIVLQQQPEAVTIIGYGEASRVTPAVLRISDAFHKQRLTVIDELRVADGRFWSYLCADLRCCPPEGRPCQPPDSVVAAEATFAGAVALPSREALSAQLEPVTGSEREAMIASTARAMLRLAALASQAPPASARTPGEPAHEPSDAAPGVDKDAESVFLRRLDRSTTPSSAGEPEAWRFHDRKASDLMVADPSSSHLGPNELRLGSVLWARLGIAVPAPQKPVRVPAEPVCISEEPVCVSEESVPAPKGPPPGPGVRESVASDPASVPDVPKASGPSGLLADEDYFFASVRAAGRLAVREAERCYSTGGRLTDDDAAWLGVLLLHVPIRDYAWTRTRTREWESTFWADLTRRVEPRYLPAPAALLAFVSWRMGFGPLASVAVERALEQQPDYSLGLLMQAALVTGLPPSILDDWPVVEGLPPIDDSPDPDDEGKPDAPARLDQSRGGGPRAESVDIHKGKRGPEDGDRPQRKGHENPSPSQVRAQIRPDTPPAEPGNCDGESPAIKGRRRQKGRRPTRRRV